MSFGEKPAETGTRKEGPKTGADLGEVQEVAAEEQRAAVHLVVLRHDLEVFVVYGEGKATG